MGKDKENKDELPADELEDLRREELPSVQQYRRMPSFRREYFSIPMEDI